MEVKRASLTNIKKISGIVSQITIIIYLAYNLFQHSALALFVFNEEVRTITMVLSFLCAGIHLVICMLYYGIRIFPSSNKKHIFSYIKPIDYIFLGFLVCNLIWIFIIPRIYGNNPGQAFTDAGRLAMLLVYFPVAILIRIKEYNSKFIYKTIFLASFAVSIWHIFMWVGESINPNFANNIHTFLENVTNGAFQRGEWIKGYGIIRVVTTNSVSLCVGFFMLFNYTFKNRFSKYLYVSVFTFAILCTFLKSLWFGLFAGILIIVLLIVYEYAKSLKNHTAIKILLTSLCVTILLNFTVFQGAVFNRVLYAFISHEPTTTSSDYNSEREDEWNSYQDQYGAYVSNSIKIEQAKKLLDKWSEHPIVGHGYGSYIEDYLRSESAVFSYEMTSFALLMKIGLLGALIWAIFALSMVVAAYSKYKENLRHFAVWLAISVCFFITIQTNPLLFSPNGMTFILFLLLDTVQENGINLKQLFVKGRKSVANHATV